jgi:tetratricopeptide (TPR) repeat protein
VSELGLSIDLSAALKTLLSQPDDLSPLVLARAMLAAAKGGVFWSDDHWSDGHWSDSRDLWWQRYRVTSDKAIALFRQAGDKQALLAALVYVAGGQVYRWGSFDHAEVLFEEALALARELGSSSLVGASLRGLGEIAQNARHDPERARQLFEESLTVERAASNTVGIAFSLHSLAWRALLDRVAARAAQLSERAVRTYLEAGSLRQVVALRLMQGVAALMEGNHSALDAMFRESFSEVHFRRFGGYVANWLALIAASWAMQGRSLHGARLFAAATRASPIHYSGLRSFEELLDECLSAGRAQTDAIAWQSAWEDGELMTLQQAMIYALEENAIPNMG